MPNQRLTSDSVETPKKGLFWFRHDLRLHDQPALDALTEQVDEISFVYIFDTDHVKVLPTDSGQSNYHQAAVDSGNRSNKGEASQLESNFPNIGKHRYRFLIETLADLSHQLRVLGHSLIVLNGNTLSCLELLLMQNGYTHLGVSQHNGFNEIKALNDIQKRFVNVELIERESFGLFNECDLPFTVNDMPQVFSPFRRKVEKVLTVRPPLSKIESLPTSFLPQFDNLPAHISLFDISCYAPKCDEGEFVEGKYVEGEFIGGESAGLRHLETYLFDWNAASTYKETRNTLDVWPDSTKLSAWLANGALSARYVMQRVRHYEETIEKNESTYWIYFELLWREFFYWLQKCHGSNWFRFSGINGVSPDTTHNTDVFNDWCNGNTGYPIVDACMRQLLSTGYMSNRGRQLVASCFVHELRQDWRHGAAWFEQQLIDYDVGSNWGNWLYLAGVGSDPRGHRQFNLQKQTETYDPDSTFRNKWLP